MNKQSTQSKSKTTNSKADDTEMDDDTKNLKSNISEVLSKLHNIKLKCDVNDESSNSNSTVHQDQIVRHQSEKIKNNITKHENIQNRLQKIENKPENSVKSLQTEKRTRQRKPRSVRHLQSEESLKQIKVTSISSKSSELNTQLSREFSVKITPENLLICNLLLLNDKERETYLIKIAKERRVLIKVNGSLEINPALNPNKFHKNLQTDFPLREPLKKTRNRRGRHPDINNKKTTESSSCENNADKINYLTEVNKILVDINEKYHTNFKLNFIGENPDSSTFYEHEENVEILDNVIDSMIKANIGFVAEGEIRINSRNNQQAFMINPNGGCDIFFSSLLLRKYAFHGDVVKVFVFNDSSKVSHDKTNEDEEDTSNKTIGFVTKIIDKVHTRRCIGSLLSCRKDAKYTVFLPRDLKTTTIRIYSENLPKKDGGKDVVNISATLFLAEVIEFNSQYAIGKIIEEVGPIGELDTEMIGIIMEHNLNITPYSDDLKQTIPEIPFIIPDIEIIKREDLRDQCIFTIDPLTARDLDDAVSLRELPNGNYEIGVHISDVTYFLEESSPVDNIAKEKTTSIYTIGKVYHMLPESLCMLCSLLPNEDKLTFSVFWEMTKNADIIGTRFARTIVNSCVQLAYEHAQAIIENPKKVFDKDEMPEIMNGYTIDDIRNVILNLFSISKRLREKRFANGALRINQPKLYFDIDPESGKPNGYSIYELKESNHLIEAFMILANQSVAEFTYSKLPEISILRNHFAPSENLSTNLQTLVSTMNLKLDDINSTNICESISKILQDSNCPEATKCILNFLSAKIMTRAKYFCSDPANTEEDLKHYALSIPFYTHFTSPIRRYPDILVHRVLSAALNYTELPTRSREELRKIANNSNVQKYNSKLAEYDYSKLFFINYIKAIGHKIMLGAVYVVNKFYMEVVLIETAHLIKIQYKDMKEVFVELIEDSKPAKVKASFKKYPEIKPIELGMLSECLLSVTVVKEKLAAYIIPPLEI